MRQHTELPRIIEALRGPTRTFVRESRVRIVLLIDGSGQVLAQHGFTRSYDVMNVSSLAAAVHASARALAELTQAPRWEHLHQAGPTQQLFLAPVQTPVEELIMVAIFDEDTSLGMVRVFYEQLERELSALPELGGRGAGTDQASFERNLAAGLDYLVPDA